MFNPAVDRSGGCAHHIVMQPSPEHGAEATLDAIFAALSDSTRRRILTMLLEDDMAVTDVAAPFEISLAAISKHLAVLAGAGLIQQEKRGRVKWCRLNPDAMQDAIVWIEGFGQVERVDLDAFERFLEREFLDDGSEDEGPA